MNDEKSKLEKKVEEGAYGEPELKKGEKDRFLGEFKERVIKYLTYDQVVEPGTYPQIKKAIKHPQARKLVLAREVNESEYPRYMERAQEYIDLAHDNNLSFKRVSSPDFKGEIALVVVSDRAVNVKKRKIINREERLKNLGISDTIIKNVGSKLCKDCWNELKEKAPAEIDNYEKLSWIDRLTGIKCINCQSKNKD